VKITAGISTYKTGVNAIVRGAASRRGALYELTESESAEGKKEVDLPPD
jgi:hypothetical protein